MSPDDEGEEEQQLNGSSETIELTQTHVGKQPKASAKPAKKIPDNAHAQTPSAKAAAVWVKVSQLTRWVKNPRQNDPAVLNTARSIRRFGFGTPMLARKANGEIIAGDTRIQAVQRLARWWAKDKDRPKKRSRWNEEAIMVATKQVAAVRYMDLTEKEAHALAIADNKTGEVAEWDDELLKEALAEFENDKDLIAATALEEKELEALLEDEDDDEEDEDDDDEDDDDDLGAGSFKIVITCKSEEQQTQLLERFEKQGLDVRALVR